MQQTNTNQEIYSFYGLLKAGYSIEIPLIQRDYAQGRKKTSIEIIRNNFLNSIKSSLDNKSPLDLNFIYGSQKKIQGEENGSNFYPIDGQQRLTTLFLIHVYFLLMKEKCVSDEYKSLRNFKYMTRPSSTKFCEYLTHKEIALDDEIRKENEICCFSKQIINNSWFSEQWLLDPTVVSMLNMLDSIDSLFYGSDYQYYIDVLFGDECPITFYFYDFEKYNLDDSIYIKLNARGQNLTNFENFKANLSKYLSDNGENSKVLIGKVDNIWSDFFWKLCVEDKEHFDEKLMRLIMSYLQNYMCLNYVPVNGKTSQKEEREWGNKILIMKPLEFINSYKTFDDNNPNKYILKSIKGLFILLDKLYGANGSFNNVLTNNIYYDEKTIFSKLMNIPDVTSKRFYEERLKFFAYSSFIIESNGNINDDSFINWLRVFDILCRETWLNASDDFMRCLDAINKLIPFKDDILDKLSNIKSNNISEFRFTPVCIKEECIKAIMVKKYGWNDLIRDAEKNKYFKGQICSILKYSGLWDAYEDGTIFDLSDDQLSLFEQNFIKYKKGLFSLFGEFQNTIGLNPSVANKFRRALLCKGDYTLKDNSNSSFLIDDSRDISWKRLLLVEDGKVTEAGQLKYMFIKELIDDNLFDPDNLETSLSAIIDRDKNQVTNWYKYIVKFPELIEFLHSNNKNHYFRRDDNGNIFFMETTRLYGMNYEYHSFALKCSLVNSGINAEIKKHKGYEEVDYHIKVTKNNIDYYVIYNYGMNVFDIKDSAYIPINQNQSYEEVYNYFMNL